MLWLSLSLVLWLWSSLSRNHSILLILPTAHCLLPSSTGARLLIGQIARAQTSLYCSAACLLLRPESRSIDACMIWNLWQGQNTESNLATNHIEHVGRLSRPGQASKSASIFKVLMYTYIYICIYIHIHVLSYSYIYRERERNCYVTGKRP